MDLENLKLKYPQKEIGRAEDLTKQIFGKWTVLYRTLNDSNNKAMWVCQCECGTIKPVAAKSLKSSTSKGCGCERLKTIAKKADEKIHQYDENNNLVLKKCFRCQQWLSLDNFWKNKTSKDGYHNECKDCSLKAKENRFNIYKKNAKKRNLVFSLTKDDFYRLTSKQCIYCGDLNDYNGIDRIDSTKGYFLENCVPCCEICNKMKLDHQYNFWISHMQKILERQKYNEIFNDSK